MSQKKVKILAIPSSPDGKIPEAARQELVGLQVPIRGSGAAGGRYVVDGYDLMGALDDSAPQMRAWLKPQLYPQLKFEIEEDVCQLV